MKQMFLLYFTLCLIHVNGNQKAFPANFDKKDFHMTTLKDPDFANDEPLPEKEKANCPDFSPEELKKIKMSYNNDGGRVKFVSADALVLDKEELKKTACLKKMLAATESGEKNMKASFDSPVKFENRTVVKENGTDNGKRRGNEYEFDTVEYYDEGEEIKFNNEVCAGLVEIIDLDIAEIKKYDIECEKLCEWNSLYDFGTWD